MPIQESLMMNLTRPVAALLLLTALPAFAAVYECTDRHGNRTYTSERHGNCKDTNLGKPNVYSSAPADKVVYTEPEPSNSAAPTGNEDLAAAQRNLEQAQRALEEGKAVRYGNERNYVRYQERIQGLQNEVDKRRAELDQLRSGTMPH